MRTTVRIGLRTISVATIGLAGWLVAVIASGLASRGQDLVALWSIVSAGSLVLASATIVATGPAARPRSSRGAVLALAFLGPVALVFGLVVLGSELTRVTGGEGYLLGLGLILTIHGLLAATWAALRVREPGA